MRRPDLTEETMNTNYLVQVQEGMRVFDRLNHEIGTVDYVKLSDDDPMTDDAEAERLSERRESFLDVVADVFRSDDLPDEVRDMLLQKGFIRIDSAGLFAADRYVTPDQIMSVTGDALTLSVTREELMKRQ
ncbi:MAG TPA: hypothetical protein PK286_11590 [Devosia sp.]|nr:hypothetical protein [Devosia sp.]